MAFTEVTIHRRGVQNFRSKILRRGGRSRQDLAVCGAHTDIVHLQVFIRAGISKDELTKGLYPSLALYPNGSCGLANSASVTLKTHRLRELIEDERLLRAIVRTRVRLSCQ